MRRLEPAGTCACCGRVGPVCHTTPTVLDFGVPTMPPMESDCTLPDLCDVCDFAQRRWDAWQANLRTAGLGYPYAEGPPSTPPVRRESAGAGN